jgi:hypothetical protein
MIVLAIMIMHLSLTTYSVSLWSDGLSKSVPR